MRVACLKHVHLAFWSVGDQCLGFWKVNLVDCGIEKVSFDIFWAFLAHFWPILHFQLQFEPIHVCCSTTFKSFVFFLGLFQHLNEELDRCECVFMCIPSTYMCKNANNLNFIHFYLRFSSVFVCSLSFCFITDCNPT